LTATTIARANAQGWLVNQWHQLDDGTWRANFRSMASSAAQSGARVFSMVGAGASAETALEAAFARVPKGEDLFD
jgi:predicted metallo-beta-lactamase superfamily hydrolase